MICRCASIHIPDRRCHHVSESAEGFVATAKMLENAITDIKRRRVSVAAKCAPRDTRDISAAALAEPKNSPSLSLRDRSTAREKGEAGKSEGRASLTLRDRSTRRRKRHHPISPPQKFVGVMGILGDAGLGVE